MYYSGYKYPKIADSLTLLTGTVKILIHIARIELNKKLNRHKKNKSLSHNNIYFEYYFVFDIQIDNIIKMIMITLKHDCRHGLHTFCEVIFATKIWIAKNKLSEH